MLMNATNSYTTWPKGPAISQENQNDQPMPFKFAKTLLLD